MSRKTSGALQIQLQTVVQALEAALSNLIKKVDALGTKIDKMPNVAKKMADGYVASFGIIAKSVEGLSSHVNKLDKIASGLTKIADGVKSFKVTETQAKSIDRLAQAFAGLGPAVAAFPRDVSGLTAFASSIDSIATALGGLEGKIPKTGQIGRLNSYANSIRNVGNALKTVGTVPKDALDALKEIRGTGGGIGGGGGTRGGGAGDGGGVATLAPSEAADGGMMSKLASTAVKVLTFGAVSAIADNLKRQNIYKELSQVMPFDNRTIGDFLPGADGTFTASSPRSLAVKKIINTASSVTGVNTEDSASLYTLAARYNVAGNRAYMDVREPEKSPWQVGAQHTNLVENAKLMNQMTNLSLSSAANLQLSMGRDLGIKSEDYKKLSDTLISVQRQGALTAKELEHLALTAKDSGMSLGLAGEAASSYVSERMKSSVALANAGVKASDAKGTMAGFFGDEKSLIFDLIAGVTDEDYRSGNEAGILKKQYAAMGMMTGGMANDRYGNFLRKQFMGEYAPASMQGGPEQYWAVSGRLGEVNRQQSYLDLKVATDKDFVPVTTALENVSMAGSRFKAELVDLTPAFGKNPNSVPASQFVPSTRVNAEGMTPSGFKESLGDSSASRFKMATPKGFAQGGIIAPGSHGGTDSVPIMATPGEEILSKSDPRHSSNALGFFRERGYRVTSGFRDDNAKSDHSRGRAVDIGMGHLKTPQEIAAFKEKLLSDAVEQGLKVRFEGKGQFNPGTGSTSSGMHAHVYGDMRGLGGAFERVGAGRLASGARPVSPLLDGASSMVGSVGTVLSEATNALRASRVAQSQPVQLDPALMSTLSDIANSNSGASDTMAQAVSMFAQVIQRLVSNSRSSSGGSDLAEAVARGNYAFSRGA